MNPETCFRLALPLTIRAARASGGTPDVMQPSPRAPAVAEELMMMRAFVVKRRLNYTLTKTLFCQIFECYKSLFFFDELLFNLTILYGSDNNIFCIFIFTKNSLVFFDAIIDSEKRYSIFTCNFKVIG